MLTAMPDYQFEVGIVLASVAVCSFAIFLLSRPREGKIQLPTNAEEEEFPQKDPFDVTTPDDLVDGTPVKEDAFWSRTRFWKLIMTLVLASILMIQAVLLGLDIVDEDSENVISCALHVFFAFYAFLLAAFALNQQYGGHSQSVTHLFGLTSVASVLLVATAILPSSEAVGMKPSGNATVPLAFWYTSIGLYIACCWIAITMPRAPALHCDSKQIYSDKTLMLVNTRDEENVCGIVGASIWDTLLFSYCTKVVMLGNISDSVEIADLPIVPADMRAANLYARMRAARRWALHIGRWRPTPGSGWGLIYRLLRVNRRSILVVTGLASLAAGMFYVPAFFLQQVIAYLERDPLRLDRGWGWVFCTGLIFSKVVVQLLAAQLFSAAWINLQIPIRTQLNTILFAKTLVRKDAVSTAPPVPKPTLEDNGASGGGDASKKEKKKGENEDDFSSKAQIMTLMTTDVDRVANVTFSLFVLVDSPIEILIATLFLYNLLGVSSFFGLAVTLLFLPMNHFAGKVVVGAQEKLMKARDERTSLLNEVLGAIRMIKFMAWERSFEARVSKVRERELKYQRLNYLIEVWFGTVWSASPIIVTLVSFWHFTVVRGQVLTPAIAFTSLTVFNEMKFTLNALPETFISMLQSFVSVRRIERYLLGDETTPVPPLDGVAHPIALQSATITWPQIRACSTSATPSATATPRNKFMLMDLSLNFPTGELSLICGKLGSGKSLLLLALLGEADLLAGQLTCPRTPPDAIASFTCEDIRDEEWVVQGVCAYVPQTAWLRNASIRDNILFELPYNEERYQKTLEVCALLSDLQILEDGDSSEIGERGVNLSGGQKARVSLARAVYSRASVLLLDDVLSAVDAHTARHLFHECLKGDLMQGRTVILVSHHVQLCAPDASYVVALDNGRVQFQGDRESFKASSVLNTLIQSGSTDPTDDKEEAGAVLVEETLDEQAKKESNEQTSEASSTLAAVATDAKDKPEQKKAPRKVIEEEKRATGRIGKDIWMTYVDAAGGVGYRSLLLFALVLAAAGPVLENGWLRIWTAAASESHNPRSPLFYVVVYGIVSLSVLIISISRWIVLYQGGINASRKLHQRILEGVLFANIRFHDTVSRGRLLNRFGKDFENVDSRLPGHFGRSMAYLLSASTTFVTICVVGGLPFVVIVVILGIFYYNAVKVYSQTARDLRRLDSVSRSPLYSIYGETIAGVTVVRAFGASSKFLRDMLRCVDTNTNPFYWTWGVARWLSARFNLLSSAVVGATAFIAVLNPRISASLAGFTLAFANTITNDLLFLSQRFVALEQSMVAVERIKEYSELKREPPEFVEPRPSASWPERGAIQCENLVIRYAPELPNVLHSLNFEVQPGEKVGVLGRTGSGKSTLALSFFRFVEPTEGRIVIDGLDIAQLGLTDLRSKLTIIPQDPTILSGTLRSMLDVFNEYEDADIYEALRRVHLIPSADTPAEGSETVNSNVFRDLDSPVSEGGENFSTGEKQLLCMARAILKRSKVLLMDEATASVDYATDELIGKTIRHEFAESTILTIAHRLRTVIDYDRIMLLEEGRIVEFDEPAVLLADPSSKFHALCKATGKNEFAMLKKMAGV